MKRTIIIIAIFTFVSCQKEAFTPTDATLTESTISRPTKERKLPTLVSSCTSCTHYENIICSGENYRPMKEVWVKLQDLDSYWYTDFSNGKATPKGTTAFTITYITPPTYPGHFSITTYQLVDKIQTAVASVIITVNP